MINNASKFALAVAGAGIVAAVAATDDKAALVLFVGMFLVAGAVAFGLGRTVGADLPPFVADDDARAATSLDPADVPRSSYGPLIVAVAVTLLAVGGALGPGYVVAAIFVVLIGAALWLFDTFSVPGVVDARDVTNLDNRLLGPIALPVGAFILAITIAFSLSRVLLAISATASWILAFVMAAVLLAVLTAIAAKVPTTRVVGSLAAVGLVGVLVAGGAGAGVGEREFHPHEEETPVVDITAQNLAFDRKVIAVPQHHKVELVFTNLDIGTFHNVAVYTAEEPGTPVFTGKPSAKGVELYRFRTPAAGTYRYVCDFHPAMVGELRVTPEQASSSEAKGAHE